MAISISHGTKGPFSPTLSSAGGTGTLLLNRDLLKHNLETPYTRHAIQIFGWNTDADGAGGGDLLCDVFVLGPAGAVPTGDDGFQQIGTLKSTAGDEGSPVSGSHTIILESASQGLIIESVAGGGFTTVRYPTPQMKLVFRHEGGAWSGVTAGNQGNVAVYVKSIQTLATQ